MAGRRASGRNRVGPSAPRVPGGASLLFAAVLGGCAGPPRATSAPWRHVDPLGALSAVKEVEQVLEARSQAQPDDIELHALAGNFAFSFAGDVPFDRRERVQRALRHFEVVRARWDDMRRGARHPEHGPDTREDFMFELAEGRRADGLALFASADPLEDIPRRRPATPIPW